MTKKWYIAWTCVPLGVVFGFSVLWSAEYIYLTTNIAQTITAQHTINTGSAQPPFVLHSNNQNQKVIGLIAETADHDSAHETGGGDVLDGNLDATARTGISKNSGSDVGARRSVNLIEGANITLTIADDSGNEEVDVTIAGASIGGYAAVQEEGSGLTARTIVNFIGPDVTCVDNSGATKTDCTVTDSEAELTNSAGLLAALNDETGTGVAVFGTNPAVDFSGGTLTLDTATSCSSGTEGRICWDSNDDKLYVGDGSNAIQVGVDPQSMCLGWITGAATGFLDADDLKIPLMAGHIHDRDSSPASIAGQYNELGNGPAWPPGDFSDLGVVASVAGSTCDIDFDLAIDGSDTALDCTMTDGADTCEETGQVVSNSAGGNVNLNIVFSSGCSSTSNDVNKFWVCVQFAPS